MNRAVSDVAIPRAGIWRRARDHFLLEDVEQHVRGRLPERQDMVGRYYRAATRRAAVAAELADVRSMPSSMLLYRDAVHLFIAAAVTAHQAEADPRALLADINSTWEALAGLARSGAIGRPPREVEAARKILETQDDPLVFEESGPEELLAHRTTMKEAVAWLCTLVEPRTLGRIHVERVLRVSILGVVVVAVLAFAVSALARPKNIALHKPVTISARHPASTAPEDNSGVVNGDIEGTYGIHTALGGGWVMVDLQSVYRLSKIKIFNRADSWFDGGLPMRLELSEDGRKWNEVDRRTTTFSASSPWELTAQDARARFVRVASDKYVALTEIQVFGAR